MAHACVGEQQSLARGASVFPSWATRRSITIFKCVCALPFTLAQVTVELSPYDLTRGRLTYRFKPGEYERMMEEQEAMKQEAAQA